MTIDELAKACGHRIEDHLTGGYDKHQDPWHLARSFKGAWLATHVIGAEKGEAHLLNLDKDALIALREGINRRLQELED